MNRRSTLLALVAAGCGAGRTATPTPEIAHHQTRGEPSAHPALDLEAGARMWRAIAPTGADYEAQLAELPDDSDLRRSMAIALLRQGDLACNAYEEEYGCGDAYLVLEPLDPAATLDDPCLRRFLALWSLEQLEPEDVDALGEVLVELASMPSPEDALQPAAFALATDDALRLRMLAAADKNIAEEYVGALESPEAKVRALVDLHLENAATDLDPSVRRDDVRTALVDPELTSYTRGALLDEFQYDLDPRTTDALEQLTEDDDCALAMRAAKLLADRGLPDYYPGRPRSQDVEANMRAMCLLAAGDVTDDLTWGGWFAAGYDTSYTAGYGTYDEDSGEYTDPEPEAEHVDADEATFDDHLAFTSWSCDGLTCTSSEGWRTVTLTFAPSTDGGLAIAAVDTEEYDEGCGC